MKAALFALLILIAATSCTRPEPPKRRATPKALEEKVSSVEILSKRASDDLINALYNELADQTPELKALEDSIEKLNKATPDSMAAFANFSAKNEAYYALANKYAGRLQDSILRIKLQQMLQNSLKRYQDTTAVHKEILAGIEKRSITLNDLHTVLKIVRTLPLIEQYQKEHLPGKEPLQHISAGLDSVIVYTDTLVKALPDTTH